MNNNTIEIMLFFFHDYGFSRFFIAKLLQPFSFLQIFEVILFFCKMLIYSILHINKVIFFTLFSFESTH